MPSLVLALLLSLTIPVQLRAQAIAFERLSVHEGLSHAKILTMLQDRQSFMWFGTLDGLNRYDGYTFTVYQNLPLDSTSLAGDVIYALHEDRDGTLWVGSSGGLSRLDRKTGTFANFLPDRDFLHQPWANDVGYIYEDRQGSLWLGMFGGGLYRMDRKAGTLTHFQADPERPTSLSNDVVEFIYEDRAGALWVSTMNGLNRFDRRTGTFARYLYPTDARYTGSIVSFTEDVREPGVFWLSGITGLYRFVPATGALEQTLDYEVTPSLQSGPTWSMPRGMVWDPAAPGVLWVVVPRSGLYRFDTATRGSTLYRYAPDDRFSFSGEPHCLYVDRTGLVWVGTERGVSRFDPAARRFRHVTAADLDIRSAVGHPADLLYNNVTALHEDGGGALWIGGGDFLVGTALTRIEPDGQGTTRWQYVQGSPDGRSDMLPDAISINVLYEDRTGLLWIGSTPRSAEGTSTLSRLDRRTGTFTHWRHDPNDPGSLGGGGVVQVYEDRAGTLWVGTTRGGLSRLDQATGRFVHYRHRPGDASSLSGNEVRAIREDGAGRLWVGTSSGLSLYVPHVDAFVNYIHDPEGPGSLGGSGVYALYERPREPGVLWVGTDVSLDRFDMRSETFVHIAAREGFPSYPVVGILEDDGGRLWMSTAGAGLLRYDPATGALQSYDETSGVQSRRFNLGAAFRSPRTGEMFFGGINGFNAFLPADIGGSADPPPVLLTDFKLFGRSVLVGRRSPLRRPLFETEEIRLTHDQNVFSFDFVALHYKNPARNQYAYKLEGFNQDWLMVGNRRMATFTNLSPGTYVFRVKAANSDGVWNEEGAAVRLTILPPWWRTPWAYGLYAVLLLTAVLATARIQRKILIRTERAKARLRENKLRAEAAEAWASYLQAENERKTQELEQARTLQLSMLPTTLPEHPLFELAAQMRTATEVGGDYYDFDLSEPFGSEVGGSTPGGVLTFAIGDATGHGAQAGTMVTATKSLFATYAGEEDLVEVLRKSSLALRRVNLPKLYMALALGRLRGRTLELVGAGMPPALLYRAATGGIEQLPLKGMSLAGPLNYPYEKLSLDLSPGDTVVLMSDGFPEMFNAAGEMFGYERAVEVFERVASAAPEEIIDRFIQTAETWANGHGPEDDMTFVVLRAKGVCVERGCLSEGKGGGGEDLA